MSKAFHALRQWIGSRSGHNTDDEAVFAARLQQLHAVRELHVARAALFKTQPER